MLRNGADPLPLGWVITARVIRCEAEQDGDEQAGNWQVGVTFEQSQPMPSGSFMARQIFFKGRRRKFAPQNIRKDAVMKINSKLGVTYRMACS